ncbi:glycosyltransferase family 2 protein [Babesia caballi]|uniref:Glycosyltransferase family 2 protein n=1 Tax=Babesia caballi TaxID=5871 RepID=A0AAV4LLN2_BABCB|nr:glycosyltransferase family 2 protein [Babesia caballi]
MQIQQLVVVRQEWAGALGAWVGGRLARPERVQPRDGFAQDDVCALAVGLQAADVAAEQVRPEILADEYDAAVLVPDTAFSQRQPATSLNSDLPPRLPRRNLAAQVVAVEFERRLHGCVSLGRLRLGFRRLARRSRPLA